MDEKLFDQLIESTKQAVSISKGEIKASRVHVFFGKDDIKTLREQKLHLSQNKFAEMLGISKRTLQEWEQGRRKPSGPANSLLKIASIYPETVLKALSH
jgi:putative transcriptional regulator